MKQIDVTCVWCGVVVPKPTKEIARRIRKGANHFFCSRACSAFFGNDALARKSRTIEKTCPVCGVRFSSSTKTRAASFCSRECASRGSITDKRREAARRVGLTSITRFDISMISKGLRTRESWKYDALSLFLDRERLAHQFEFPLGNSSFDLALFDKKILVEFDAPEHQSKKVKRVDEVKDALAAKHGWRVVRIAVSPSTVIHPEAIHHLL